MSAWMRTTYVNDDIVTADQAVLDQTNHCLHPRVRNTPHMLSQACWRNDRIDHSPQAVTGEPKQLVNTP